MKYQYTTYYGSWCMVHFILVDKEDIVNFKYLLQDFFKFVQSEVHKKHS